MPQIPDGLMPILIVVTICLVVQTMVQFGYFVLEIVRDGKDHEEAPTRVQTLQDESGIEIEVKP